MLQYTPIEINSIHEWELERFSLINPTATIYRWIKGERVDNRWGHILDKDYLAPVITLHVDFNWNKKLRVFENGVWITTNNIEVFLCRRECETILGVDDQYQPIIFIPKEGDVIELMGDKLEILSARETKLIEGTQFEYLQWVCVVDTVQKVEA